jgi:hypothetical protein
MSWVDIGSGWWSVVGLGLDIAGFAIIARDAMRQASLAASTSRSAEYLDQIRAERVTALHEGRPTETVEKLFVEWSIEKGRREQSLAAALLASTNIRLGAGLIVLGFALQLIGAFATNQAV